jgi:branched-chain amino acid transport system permease protein
MEILQSLINGILLGGIYAAVGVGLSMIFGIVRMVNLAHGDLMILAAYLALALMGAFGVDPYVSLIGVLPIMFVVGYLLQMFVFNRVLGKGMEPPLIVAFGLSIILQNVLLLIFSPDDRSLETVIATGSLPISQTLSVPTISLVGFLVGSVVIVLVQLLMKRTSLGRAIRAASDDEGAAQLMGINTRKIYSVAMGIAMVTAAVAGTLIGTTYSFNPATGPQYLIIAFGVVIIGGAGSMLGTFVGGMVLGLAQLMGAYFFGTGYQLLSGYLILLIVLALRPQGLFGRKERSA